MLADVASQTYILQDRTNVSLHKTGTNSETVDLLKGIQERFSLSHIAVWTNMNTLQVCSDEWFNIHTTDQ